MSVPDDTPARSVAPITTSFLNEVPLPLEDPSPSRVGGYRVVRVLGRGGMGTVYEAEQESTRRFVALKLIHPHLATPRYRRRFAEEIRTLGKFEHPGIARIHDAGSAPDDRGAVQLFFAMELVAGVRLDQHVASQSLGPVEIASLMAGICDAVHHAHQKSVIHCDLKPANILVATDGTSKILDFGIARIVGDDAPELSFVSGPGDHGSIVGTLAFASPEQGAGDRNRFDVLTDVFGLGAVLYALLASRPPHDVRGCSLAEAARIVRDVLPQRVRSFAPQCPADLETIVAKASAHTPSDRYDSAAAMAADLRRFVERRPILARPTPWRELAAKWIRRNRIASASIGIASTSIVAVGVSVSIAVVQVLAAQHDQEELRSAIQGSQLTVESSHQRSAAFMEHLQSDELPGYLGRVLVAMTWGAATPAGQVQARSQGRLFAFGPRGRIVDHLDGRRALPAHARPRFDINERFERRIGMPLDSSTSSALIDDCDAGPARELVRGLSFPTTGPYPVHTTVLEMDDVKSVITARGVQTATVRQIWSAGMFLDVVWDSSRGLLWSLSGAEELHYFVPELAAWDSAGCPVGRDVSRLLVAFKPADMHGVLPPLRGDLAHPPVPTTWAFTTRPPPVSGDADARSGELLARGQLGQPSPSGAVYLHLQAFEPYPVSEGRGLGRLYVCLRRAEAVPDAIKALEIASVELDANGDPRGAFRLEPVPGQEPDPLAVALVAQFDPAAEILTVDLNELASAWPEAEDALREHGQRDVALEHIAASPDSAIARCIDAMTNNWRWLLNSAGEIVEREAIVAGLGARFEGRPAIEIATALARLNDATRIHASRCPNQGNLSCKCEWYIASESALAFCALGDWTSCVEAARRSINVHDHQPALGDRNPADHAILAIALDAMGEQAHAEAALADAERETDDELLTARLIARARILIRGSP